MPTDPETERRKAERHAEAERRHAEYLRSIPPFRLDGLDGPTPRVLHEKPK
jgi:hypothetical protein